MSDSSNTTFFIKSEDQGFASRQKSIFDQLSLLDKEKKTDVNDVVDVEDVDTERSSVEDVQSSVVSVKSMRQKRKETKHFRGKESIFKRPETLPPRFKARDIPDYQRNPNKWVKYTLADVSQDDMSERSNTATAMAFLRELESRKPGDSLEEDADCKKIKFRPQKKLEQEATPEANDPDDSSSDKGLFRSSKLVMPEYIVGREKKKDLKRKNKSISFAKEKNYKEIKLDHLDDDDEDE